MQAISLSIFRFDDASDRIWAFSQMQFSRAALRRMPGASFVKQFGTGTGEGFTPLPNFGVYAVMCTWPSLERAREAVECERPLVRYQSHASETLNLFLSATSSRGEWDGRKPFEVTSPPTPSLPVAVLTRATVKPSHVMRFWRHTPGISDDIRRQNHLMFKLGMGEVPWLQQVTFSIWNDVEALRQFAYQNKAHREAIADVRNHNRFKEELYARFEVLASEGSWMGQSLSAGTDQQTPKSESLADRETARVH
ncbi:MAG: spheroidene monooxygenase [Pseudomonadota bacterium]